MLKKYIKLLTNNKPRPMKTIKINNKTIKTYSFEESFGKYFKSKSFVKNYKKEIAKLKTTSPSLPPLS